MGVKKIALTLVVFSAITGIAIGSSFYDLVGEVYKQQEENRTILCVQSVEELQTLDELRSTLTNVWESLKYNPTVDAKRLGVALRKAEWGNAIAYPSYREQDYYVHRTGEEPTTAHTKAGTSCATWVNDTQNQTIDIVNLIWKGDAGIKIYINLYDETHTGKQRLICRMNVTHTEWDCGGHR